MPDLSAMKLYNGGRAPNPRRVQIFMAEKGISVPTVEIDINRLEQRSAEFTRINPLQRVPVLLLEDGTAISETVAICRYFEEICPTPPLMGVNAREKALVEMWQRRIELQFLLPVGFAFRHLHPGAAHLESPQIAEWGMVNQGRAREFLELLDRELAGRAFIAGDVFTIADITAIVAYQFLKPARLAYPQDLACVMRWRQAVSSRPSVAPARRDA